ncbi:carbohydrate-binding domain-containing protein [Azospirillum rugosum]|uniref:Parallel beta-helix repeat protein n=1 Tax=Azospirillum rugosum TaxID=416170 RepID=A0ABS4SGN4_9PROT|nr:carbohydrate-binding domain-containing protein [Azospirillum rugosum]MBP2291726.1 parallel beta-helix repeat protein [Azospirillum rugosum]MDQ0524462.1 parallel beta-helix repeat protein [Azospirillum rugosum]
MATTTTGQNDAKIVVNAYGQSAGGIWPHFRLLIDGVDAGQATVSATSPSAYTFTAPVSAAQAHKLQIVYDNDGSAGGQDRNLFVRSVVVNGNTLSPNQGTYDKGAIDGRDIITGQEGLYWPGALNFATPASYYPASTASAAKSTITVNAQGLAAGGVNAHFNLLVDGKKVGEGTVGTTAKDYSFSVDATRGTAHKVQVQYDNDAVVNGQDRSLIVNKITINGTAHNPTDSLVTYDKGALDGVDVVKGQSGMWWNGTLQVAAPASEFPSTTTPTAPTTGNTSITVNAQGNAAGGVNAHFKLLVDGKAVGEGTVGTTAKDYTFKTDVAQGQAHKIQIQYDNDAVVNGQDRSLIVNKVTINGHAVSATDSNVTYDKGALDGQDVVKGQSGLWWNGTLQVAADKSWFPGTSSGGDTGGGTGGNTGGGTGGGGTGGGNTPTGPAIYVAANGKDSWSGKLAAPNADGTDGPKATLGAARDAMRADPNIDTTYVRGGDYHVKDVVWLDSQDSGVKFLAYGTEKPVIHGDGQASVLIGLGGAKNVTIDGLTLTDTRTDGHAVYANNASGLTFTDNTVKGGGYGITVEGSANSHVTGNTFISTGAESIYVKAGSNFTDVSDNLVQRPNAANIGDAGIWVNGSSDVKVTHNQVENTPAKAIAVGSVETTGSDATYRVSITDNKVINANLATSDGGGIYLINRQQDLTGSVVAHNEVTGTSVSGGGDQVSWGIYLDDWTSGARVEDNLVHGNIGGIFLHGGWNNTVTNNIVADNTGAQIGLQQSVAWGGYKGHAMTGNSITENIFDVAKGSAVHIYGPGNVGTFTGNIYSHIDTSKQLFDVWPQVLASGSTGKLSDWQAAGYDKTAVVLDPHFTDAAHGNYTLASDSAAYGHGFDHLPTDIIGLLTT